MTNVSICSPNYLHDSHIRFSLRHQADAICEKPIVLNPWNIDALQEIEKETGKKVFTIFQLRFHPRIIELREKIKNGPADKTYNIDLTYITSRDNWYGISWKGDIQKSGGVATNIGVHFFDMLSWIFGKPKYSIVHLSEKNKAAGFLELENARVRWLLSIDPHDLPAEVSTSGKRTYRSIKVDGEEFEFSEGFTELGYDTAAIQTTCPNAEEVFTRRFTHLPIYGLSREQVKYLGDAVAESVEELRAGR